MATVVLPIADVFAVHGGIEADAHALSHILTPRADVLVAVGEVVGALAGPHIILPVACQRTTCLCY